jgi:hypothetical protein
MPSVAPRLSAATFQHQTRIPLKENNPQTAFYEPSLGPLWVDFVAEVH